MQRARVVDIRRKHEVIYLVYNLVRDVTITVASTQYEHERQKIQ